MSYVFWHQNESNWVKIKNVVFLTLGQNFYINTSREAKQRFFLIDNFKLILLQMQSGLTLFKLGYFDDKDGWGGAKIAPPIYLQNYCT